MPDTVPGVSYHTGKKAWINVRVFLERLNEISAIPTIPGACERAIFLNKASGYKFTDAVTGVLMRRNIDLRFFLKCSPGLCTPADRFAIQKVKTTWMRMWDELRMSMIQENVWNDSMKGSHKFPNPGKKFCSELAAKAVRYVDNQRIRDSVTFTTKAMIRYSLARSVNGTWEVKYICPHLP